MKLHPYLNLLMFYGNKKFKCSTIYTLRQGSHLLRACRPEMTILIWSSANYQRLKTRKVQIEPTVNIYQMVLPQLWVAHQKHKSWFRALKNKNKKKSPTLTGRESNSTIWNCLSSFNPLDQPRIRKYSPLSETGLVQGVAKTTMY